MSDLRLSRRAVLAGLGMAGTVGAAKPGVAHALPVPEVPNAAAASGNDIAAGEAFVASRSLKLNAFDFWPDQPEQGRFVSSLGTFTNVANGNIEAVVRLPDGANPIRVDWKVFNNSGGLRTVVVYQITWPFIALNSAGFSTVGSSGSGLQSVSTTLSGGPQDPNVYLLRMPTLMNGTAALYTAEFFYDDPNVSFRPVAPQVRKLDTRAGGAIANGEMRTLSLRPELPSSARFVLLNLTLAETTGTGFLSLFPAGTAWPGTSTINWYRDGQVLANSATTAVSASAEVTILAGGLGSAHLIVDLLGYYY